MLNAAIVGLGVWGRQLVDSVLEDGRPKSQRIRFTRAVTRTPAKAVDYAKRQGLSLSDDYGSILGDADVQAVVLATPPRSHPTEIEAALAAGKHSLRREALHHGHGERRAGGRFLPGGEAGAGGGPQPPFHAVLPGPSRT